MRFRPALALTGLLPVGAASAHGFGRVQSLPVPFALYAWAAVATLLLTFLVAAAALRARDEPAPSWPATPRPAGRLAGIPALLAWLLAMACGWLGVRNPFANLNMTLFWIGFVLIVPYLSALLGDLNARCNPFHALLRLASLRPRLAWPDWLASWPALLLYMAFVLVELFGAVRPADLSWLLLAYGGITLAGGWLFGSQAWLRGGECFSVMIRLLALMAPRQHSALGARWQWPFASLLRARCNDYSELVFLLFLLTATSFDGLHETAAWARLYWTDLMQLLSPWITPPLLGHYAALLRAYLGWQLFWLLAFPFLYGGAYLLCMRAMQRLTGTALSVRALALRFGLTLVPIIFVYHLGHYFSLLVTQGTQLVPLLSDPLGRGWNLFGTATWVAQPVILPDVVVWHVQVVLIVAGHGVSVWLAHVEALRLFRSPRLALRSQWPLLGLMLFLTVFGLWILAQPFSPPEILRVLQTG